jgi:hypothetical protein
MPTVYTALKQAAAKKPAAAAPAAGAPAAAAAATPDDQPANGAGQSSFYNDHPVVSLFLFVGLLFAFAAAAPLLAGFSNFMGWIIIGIALYEAWKLNKRPKIVFQGPFPVG